MTPEKAIKISTNILRYTFVVFLLLIGGDKVLHTNWVAQWDQFIGPVGRTIYFHAPSYVIITCQGVVEVTLGLLILLTPFVRTMITLFIITIIFVLFDLFALGYVILALRDLLAIFSGIALIVLRSIRKD
ncbi:MAG: hypothetical protein JWL75_163 [Parcubacteria group bacterium]|nr:hypothetical protein [Parcubacteria group bacterium]